MLTGEYAPPTRFPKRWIPFIGYLLNGGLVLLTGLVAGLFASPTNTYKSTPADYVMVAFGFLFLAYTLAMIIFVVIQFFKRKWRFATFTLLASAAFFCTVVCVGFFIIAGIAVAKNTPF